MKKIAVLNDLSGMGKCSLTAAIPVISVMGIQACPLPTAVLSAQTGFPSYYCDDYTDRMDAIMEEWKKMDFIRMESIQDFWQTHVRPIKQLNLLNSLQKKTQRYL